MKELLVNRTQRVILIIQHYCHVLGADSVVYLTVEGLVEAVQSGIEDLDKNDKGHCTACLTGTYPVELEW